MRRLATSLFVALTVVAATSAAAAADSKGDIVLDITNVTDNPQGTLRCGLYTKSNWLDAEDAVEWVDATYTEDGGATCRFESVDSGTYGIGVFHDADDDHDMDTNFLGIPSEGLCASKDPDTGMGPPEFGGASFNHGDGETTRVSCTMNY